MPYEYLVICGLIFCLTIYFLKNNRKLWAAATIPLIIVPGGSFINEMCRNMFPEYRYIFPIMFIYIILLSISSLLTGLFGMTFKAKKTKITYVSVCMVFNVVLTLILCINYS